MAVNGLVPVPIETFGGLNLTVDPEELGFGGAVDMMNVQIDRAGVLTARPGAVRQFDTPAVSAPGSVMPFKSSSGFINQVLIGGEANVTAYDTNGTFRASATFASNPHGWYGLTSMGTPSAAWAFAGNSINPIQRWDGSAWSAPTATVLNGTNGPMPKAGLLAVTPWDNRLIATGFGPSITDGGPGNVAGSSSRSIVWFSEPGDPLTWQGPGPQASPASGNYVQLSPGDGEWIAAVAVWQNYVFVFKQTKFFVFYGVSTDATGKPIFNYRTVPGRFASGMNNAGVNTEVSFYGVDPQGVAVGPDGVYFNDNTGIWRTSGSTPVELSAPIRGLWASTVSGFTAQTFWTSTLRYFWSRSMVFHNRRLYASFQGGTPGYPHGVLVYDTDLKAWFVWDVPVRSMMVWRVDDPNDNFVAFTKLGSSGLFIFGPNYTVDVPVSASVPISWYYQTGFSDLGAPAREKTIRETEIIGSGGVVGSVSLQWARDFQNPGSAQSVSLDTTRGNRGLDRSAHIGELLSFRLSSTGAATINRVVPMLRETRGVGEKTS